MLKYERDMNKTQASEVSSNRYLAAAYCDFWNTNNTHIPLVGNMMPASSRFLILPTLSHGKPFQWNVYWYSGQKKETWTSNSGIRTWIQKSWVSIRSRQKSHRKKYCILLIRMYPSVSLALPQMGWAQAAMQPFNFLGQNYWFYVSF